VLTNNLGVTLAGTTSMAGLGVASFRYGTQADNAVEIEVVTGAGEILTCNAEQNREACEMFRCGLGQFGLITKVTMRLRECPPNVRAYTLLYDDLAAFMHDAEALMWDEDQAAATVGGICSPCPLGFRKIGDGLGLGTGVVGFARWFYPMFPTIEFADGEEPDDSAFLSKLTGPELVHVHDVSQEFFCRRMEPMFELWHVSGYWEQAHPWMETIMPWDAAQSYIDTVLSNLPPGALGGGGHVLLWPSRTDSSSVPLFKHPGGKQVMGWGVLGAVPPTHLEQMLASLDMASEMSIAMGGKRYLSGYITFDSTERWANHYGDAWPRMCEAKKRFDPANIFGSGFIQFE
jgi:FAD/FMN-containing dehydrogenase